MFREVSIVSFVIINLTLSAVEMVATFSRSVSKTVTISTSSGFSSIVEAKIGYSQGQTITDTISSSITLPPLYTVDWYVDWRIRSYNVTAQFRNVFGNITDTGSWSATVPLYQF
ncbi:hypothetical protein PW5551_10420 [Petrotoga sp. 9PW.55.5.1]|uniref:hypothetical protein n=1 Tax=Petrotoga sp. 9PW.55.5.1 TaxID=1308979 RepID=UPI000DC2304E|nr:hypothetical protein [Petrotoga sp. 9PW.55.5.1]RAO98345.1 hypothetical protein PW5551_10420 [Petrotoga sp. 9PW.55.5.1]